MPMSSMGLILSLRAYIKFIPKKSSLTLDLLRSCSTFLYTDQSTIHTQIVGKTLAICAKVHYHIIEYVYKKRIF